MSRLKTKRSTFWGKGLFLILFTFLAAVLISSGCGSGIGLLGLRATNTGDDGGGSNGGGSGGNDDGGGGGGDDDGGDDGGGDDGGGGGGDDGGGGGNLAIVLVDPSEGLDGLDLNTTVTVTFGEEMDPSTINEDTIVVTEDGVNVPGTVELSEDQLTVTYTPDDIFAYNSDYVATIKGGETGVKSETENTLAEDYDSDFQTRDGLWGTDILSMPRARYGHAAVWDGTHMIIWGGAYQGTNLSDGGNYLTGEDEWENMTRQGAPQARDMFTSVLVGDKLVVWGGRVSATPSNTGGVYDPQTNTWESTSTGDNTPAARRNHTAISTGTRMIIWGGAGDATLDDGAIYDPGENTWQTMAAGAETKWGHVAVWTDSEMIVWGGYDPFGAYSNTGGRYNLAGNSWTAMTTDDAPDGRVGETAVWTGSEMIVWGGYNGGVVTPLNSGGAYDPLGDVWSATSPVDAPSKRYYHTAVWTGSKMIVWGGLDFNAGEFTPLNTGGVYDPDTSTWTATSLVGAPSARFSHSAIWTGTHMIVWGGSNSYVAGTSLGDGYAYDPDTNTWAPIFDDIPKARTYHTTIWDGAEMILWGGYNGAWDAGYKYNPAENTWSAISTIDEPDRRQEHAAVWTGTELIIWGGFDEGLEVVNDGATYNPTSDEWTVISAVDAPAARRSPSAVWTETEMIVWGGLDGAGAPLNTGARYNPTTDTWTAMETVGAPTARAYHTAIWDGEEMIIWGGLDGDNNPLNNGKRYDPQTNAWSNMSSSGAPSARYDHTAVWSGSKMIVWGGRDTGDGNGGLNTGGRYDPYTNRWQSTSTTDAPEARLNHSVVWTGAQMIVWGGNCSGTITSTGGLYNPLTNKWETVSTGGVPNVRMQHTAVWTGTQMIVWGGTTTGGLYADTGTIFE